MATWMTAKELGDALGLGLTRSQDIIKSRHYKKQSLTVRYEKSKKGKPTALVLWDTETNQPATPGDTDHAHPSPTPAPVFNQGARLIQSVAGSLNDDAKSQPAQLKSSPELDNAGAKTAAEHHDSLPIAAQPKKPDDHQKAQTTALPKVVYMAVDGSEPSSPEPRAEGICVDIKTGEVMPTPNDSITIDGDMIIEDATGEIINGQLDPLTVDDFETLLHRKLLGKNKAQQRRLRWHYRKQYADNGVIPKALHDQYSGQDGRITAGRKSTLDPAIAERFIDIVKSSNDPTDPKKYHTAAHCKVTIFHQELEYEFKHEIPINALYGLVKKHGLGHYFERIDDGDHKTAKPPSFVSSEPIGESLLLDGVGADYLTINGNGKPVYPWWINFMDYGSRRIMAIYAYTSETNEASVDIFNRYLIENRHSHAVVKLRPDNAKGFLNLKRCIAEINVRKKARPGGFTMIDDFSRPGTPVDKAALESSHRALHNFERYIINRFKDRIVGQAIKTKKFGNAFRDITVTHLDITLDELNASGVIQEYQRRHNSLPHRPVVNGKQTSWLLDAEGKPVVGSDGKKIKWIPDAIWQQHLAMQETFTFDAADLEANRIYGYSKHKGTITKQGYVQYQSEKYHVSDPSLYSTRAGTAIQYSVIGGGKLALFNAQQDGRYLGLAVALQETAKPQKIIDLEQRKIQKATEHTQYRNIVDQFAPFELFFNEDEIKQLIDQGLTEDITKAALAAPKVYMQNNKIKQYNFFKAEAKDLISQAKTPKTASGITR